MVAPSRKTRLGHTIPWPWDTPDETAAREEWTRTTRWAAIGLPEAAVVAEGLRYRTNINTRRSWTVVVTGQLIISCTPITVNTYIFRGIWRTRTNQFTKRSSAAVAAGAVRFKCRTCPTRTAEGKATWADNRREVTVITDRWSHTRRPPIEIWCITGKRWRTVAAEEISIVTRQNIVLRSRGPWTLAGRSYESSKHGTNVASCLDFRPVTVYRLSQITREQSRF